MQIMESTNIQRRQREKAAAQVPALRERRTHEARSADTQSALVEAAIAMLCELGYAGITTAEVARRAGCTTGAMHHQFGSKDELMFAVLARLSLEFEERYVLLAVEHIQDMTLAQRCEKAIEVLAGYYTDPRYVAIWELYVGTRCEPALNQLCIQNRTRVIAEFERVWLTAFAEAGVKKNELVALMRFTMIYLRSFGLNQTLGTDPNASAGQLDILRSVLLAKLAPQSLKPAVAAAAPPTTTTRRKPKA